MIFEFSVFGGLSNLVGINVYIAIRAVLTEFSFLCIRVGKLESKSDLSYLTVI